MAVISYIRVSTAGQELDLQRSAVERAGAERIFEDVASAAAKERPGLAAALDYCREGDVFTVWRLDRAFRSTSQALTTIDELAARGVGFRSLTEDIDSTGPLGRILLTLIAAFAELERNVIRQRTVAGLEAARQRGATFGRPRVLTPTQAAVIRAEYASGRSVTAIARELGVSRSSAYRALKKGTST